MEKSFKRTEKTFSILINMGIQLLSSSYIVETIGNIYRYLRLEKSGKTML